MPEMPCNCSRPPSPRFTSPPSQRSADFSWKALAAEWLAVAIIAIGTAISITTVRAQQPAPGTASGAAGATGTELSGGFRMPDDFRMKDKPINFDQERIQLTIAYRRLHQDPKAADVIIQPKMIILHWTGIPSFISTWNYFNRTHAEDAREQLAAAGEVNVSAQFLVDRDGTVYRLMPENWMARHCIGLNHVAIGVENVGDGEKFSLT